jgi:hypothetical protein
MPRAQDALERPTCSLNKRARIGSMRARFFSDVCEEQQLFTVACSGEHASYKRAGARGTFRAGSS